MQIRVLGCSGSIAAGNRTTSFLVDDDVLVDAGTGVADLTLEEMARVDHIFVTHSHLDHILSIGLLADSVTRLRHAAKRPPVQVHALADTLAALRAHILNGIIWPDFTRLPERDAPVLALHEVTLGERLTLGERTIEVLPATHTVPAVGYAVTGGTHAGAWVFTGDTGPNPALWARLATMRVHSLVIETAFRDDELELARISRHLCPSQLAEELAKFASDAAVYITHIKPGELQAVMAEVKAQGGRRQISALFAGQLLSIE